MSNLKLSLLLLTLACVPSNTANLGVLKQEIYIPWNYGMESGGNALRCDTDWTGGKCYVPDSRTARIYIVDGTCPAWYRTRIANAIIDMNTIVSPYGFSIQQVSFNDPFTYDIACEAGTSGPAAYTWYTSSQDCHDTPRGELCQTRGGHTRIRHEYINSKPVFQNATSDQQRWYVANVSRHEIGHLVLGFGHLPGTQQGTKLMAKGFPDDLSSQVWNSLLGPDSDELYALDCYTPSSGTGDSC